MRSLPSFAIVVITTLVTASLTEFISNTTAANVLQPVLGQLAVAIGINPLLLMLPAAFGKAFAFTTMLLSSLLS